MVIVYQLTGKFLCFLLSIFAKRSTKVKEWISVKERTSVKEGTSMTQTSAEATSGSVLIGPNIAYEGVTYSEEAIYEHPL